MSIPSAAVATRPISDIDPFSNAYILDPYPFHEQLREAGPLVWLQKWDVWAVTRYEQVKAVLTDWKNFCSSGGVGLSNFRTERPWRTLSLLLETDPPDHTRHREVVGRLLSPSAVRGLRDQFEREAQKIIESVLNAGPFDAIPVLAEAYPLKAFGDAVGVVPEGRSHLVAWGNMVFNTMGPRNEHYERSLGNSKPVFEWLNAACRRENLSSDGLGAQIYTALDDGIVSERGGPASRWFLSIGRRRHNDECHRKCSFLLCPPSRTMAASAQRPYARSRGFGGESQVRSPVPDIFPHGNMRH